MNLQTIIKTSPTKTIRFNLHYFGIKGLRFPVLIARNYRLNRLRGIVELEEFNTGTVRLGYGSVGIFDPRDDRGIWQNDGKVIFRGKAILGLGSKISCGESGKMVFGGGFINTAKSDFVCHHEMIFGDNCLISWDCLFMDTDFHTLNEQDKSLPVIVGDNVWVCCRSMLLKGAYIPDGAVIAAGATVTKRIEGKAPLIVQVNKVIKINVAWLK